uniref:Uncharacterized protein n=1 Tax=Anguilla anguilla TaxID=7936 RepID=A0A0E9VWB0_ANGAN
MPTVLPFRPIAYTSHSGFPTAPPTTLDLLNTLEQSSSSG